jgi:hypothetical protein
MIIRTYKDRLTLLRLNDDFTWSSSAQGWIRHHPPREEDTTPPQGWDRRLFFVDFTLFDNHLRSLKPGSVVQVGDYHVIIFEPFWASYSMLAMAATRCNRLRYIKYRVVRAVTFAYDWMIWKLFGDALPVVRYEVDVTWSDLRIIRWWKRKAH